MRFPRQSSLPIGIDCGMRDPFGNSIRFTQPKS